MIFLFRYTILSMQRQKLSLSVKATCWKSCINWVVCPDVIDFLCLHRYYYQPVRKTNAFLKHGSFIPTRYRKWFKEMEKRYRKNSLSVRKSGSFWKTFCCKKNFVFFLREENKRCFFFLKKKYLWASNKK